MKIKKKFIRLRSLGSGYSEEEIEAVIHGNKSFVDKKRVNKKSKSTVNLFSGYTGKITGRRALAMSGGQRFSTSNRWHRPSII